MPPNYMPPQSKAAQAAVPTLAYRTFTRLDQHGRATTEEFECERMGIAAKE